jgi:ABC-type uncharacterized transport system substrate-binding protein
VNFPHLWRESAIFVDKILKGAKPADLPHPTSHAVRVDDHLKTANALGLTIPQSMLQRWDRVIE